MLYIAYCIAKGWHINVVHCASHCKHIFLNFTHQCSNIAYCIASIAPKSHTSAFVHHCIASHRFYGSSIIYNDASATTACCSTTTSLATSWCNIAHCFVCITPARDKFVRLMRALSFPHCTKEKLLSTDVLLGNAVAGAPQSCRRCGKRPFI